ncbi:hypothetical protein [Mycoplasma simbae]|uniref:hypothetical protein n=1 Tax=Mycoplasma simbae TaxID=36744 RepID=UPI000497C487|nr:hypothetical protein [Mycoplasma simbae]
MKKLGLISLSLMPVLATSSCFLDGEFNKRKENWDFSTLQDVQNYKNISESSVKISFKEGYSPKFKHDVIAKEAKNITNQEQAVSFIKKYFYLSLIALRPHQGWDAGNNFSHIHQENISNVFVDSDKVLHFEINLIQQPKLINLNENKLSFHAQLASKNFDQTNKQKPLYYLDHNFEIDLGSQNE